MRNRLSLAVVVAIVASVVAGGLALTMTRAAGQTARSQGPQVPRRPNGKPDFSGIWQAHNGANWDLLAHAARPMVAQPGVYPGVVEGDEIPYQPWAATRKQENFDNWLDRDPEIGCFLPGVPRAMYMPYPFQIIHG